LNDARLQMAVRDRVFDQMLHSIFWNAVNFGIGFILLFAGQSMADGRFTVGDFALFVYFLGWITDFTSLFGVILARYQQAGVSFKRMIRLLGGAPPETVVEHGPAYLSGAYPQVPGIPPTAAGRLDTLDVAGLTYRY